MKYDKLNKIIEDQIDELINTDATANGARNLIDKGQVIARLIRTAYDGAWLALELEKFKTDYDKKDTDLPAVLRDEKNE